MDMFVMRKRLARFEEVSGLEGMIEGSKDVEIHIILVLSSHITPEIIA